MRPRAGSKRKFLAFIRLRRGSGAGNATNNFRRRLRGAACWRVIRGLRPRMCLAPTGRDISAKGKRGMSAALGWLVRNDKSS